MAYKCKVCGYRFKSTDDDLCPQCFTAREDVSCFDTPKHSHEKDRSESRSSFAEKERFRENIPTVDEAAGSARRQADELQKKYAEYKNAQRTNYSSNPRTSATAKYMAQNYSFNVSPEAEKRYSSPNSQYKQYNYAGLQDSRKKTSNKVKGFTVAFILIFFVLPIAAEVIQASQKLKRVLDEAEQSEQTVTHMVEIDTPSLPDIDFPQIFDYDYTQSDNIIESSPIDKENGDGILVFTNSIVRYDYSEIADNQLEKIDNNLNDEDFNAYYIDFVNEVGTSIERSDCVCMLLAEDAHGMPVYNYTSDLDQNILLLNNKVQRYYLTVEYTDAGDHLRTMRYEFTLDDFLTYNNMS